MASNVQHDPLMVKAFATSALVLAGVTLIFVACSSNSDSTFGGDPPKPDAESDAPGPLLPEGGGPDSGGDGGGVPCKVSIPNSFTPTWKAPTRAVAACSSAELKMYWDSCLADPGMTEANGTCAAFKAAHAACGACAEPDDQSGPIQWRAMRAAEGYGLNLAGCLSVTLEGTDAGASGCGEAYNAAVQCTRASCTTCISNPMDYSECEKTAGMTGLCASKETAQAAACQGYKNAGSPALGCFPNTAEQTELGMKGISESFYTRIVALTCGP